MSELIVNSRKQPGHRWELLAGVSGAVLASYLLSANAAQASEKDQPMVWIELGAQFANQSADEEPFIPPFVQASPFDGAIPLARKRPPSGWFENGKISFEPVDSDWSFSLGVRYGKNSRQGVTYQKTRHGSYYLHTAYQNSRSATSEKHLIVDFQAGKDVGLGRIGAHGTSMLSAGVRYAKFDSHSSMNIKSVTQLVPSSYYIFNGSFAAQRKFIGVGPSLSWDASANLTGNPEAGSLTLDWGVNGAVLFGRQKVSGQYQKTQLFQPSNAYFQLPRTTVYRTVHPFSRSKGATVPNLGGFAALSLRYPNAKVSLGYRVDYFFGAVDGGIDQHKAYDRGFYGPFASISIGLGG
ncbi:MAG TPA: hypothetical protein VMS78_15470 [Rhizomicrobium sp.]|nr:hypothetical protein [Rhizomicrobium sp.]